MNKCPACNNTKMKKIWQGNARKGMIGNYSNSISKSYRCYKCRSIASIQSSLYGEEFFKSGHYRKLVDGKNSKSKNNYLLSHFDTTLSYISNVKKEYIVGKKVLDFGSGAGSFLKLISPFINLGVGIELDKNFHFKENNIENVLGFKESDKICKKFDLITSYSVFGQLLDGQEILKNLVSRLKKNGILIIADINANDYLLTDGNKKYKDEIFFRQSYQNYYTKKGLIVMAKNNNLSFLSSTFIQRYDYYNTLKYVEKKNLDSKIKQTINKKNIKKYFKKYFELEEISDYMIITFKKI